jgi:adenylate kinase family enzyme
MISLIQLLKESQSKPKALILAGAPGSGKSSILKDLNLDNIPSLNLDDTIIALSKVDKFTLNQKDTDFDNRSKFMRAMQKASAELKNKTLPNTISNSQSFILDGTSSSYKNTKELHDKLIEAGYEVAMLYVYTDLETSLKRNERRYEKSKGTDRSLVPSTILKTWYDVTKNFEPYKTLFDNFIPVSNTGKESSLKDIEDIVDKYITPFTPKDGREKSEKEIKASNEKKQKLNKDLQSFLSSPHLSNIINSSLTKSEAQEQIKQFIK